MSLNIAGEDGFWAELTAESPTIPGRYSWKAVDLGTDGTAWVDADSAAIGNYATDMAREANSGAGLTGSVVWLYPAVGGSVGAGQDPEYYLFAAGSVAIMACVHVSSVQCTGGLLIVTYDTVCV